MLKKLLSFVKKQMLKNRFTTVLGIFLKWFFRVGPMAAIAHTKHFTAFDKQKISIDVSDKERYGQENFPFRNNVKFSVLVPLYNTPESFLREMIESVVNQTYKNFELCLADGSDDEHSFVEKVCCEYAQKDNRIVYKKLNENKGIAENTNECIKMSSGEYIALFDHDDLLHPSALFKVALAIEQENADFIYTDEYTFDGSKGKGAILARHYKPDFSYDNLLANNYICHLSVFKASLLDKVGVFRTMYDGSQDHDMILRLTSAAEKVIHIPEMLYFWRSHKNSVAMDIGSKLYAVKSGIRLVEDHLKEQGIEAKVESSPAFPTIYRVSYKIKDNPLVSVIISAENSKKASAVANAVLSNTDYNNYEVIITIPEAQKVNCRFDNDNITVLGFEEKISLSSAYNLAAGKARGDYLLFLDENCLPTHASWLKELLSYAQFDYAGAVGAKVLNKNKTVKSTGKILSANGVMAERYAGTDKSELGYFGKLFYSQNISAVATDCFMVKRGDFEKASGFDEKLQNSLFDTDLCLKLMEMGKKNLVNPFCVTLSDIKTVKATEEEQNYFKAKWKNTLDKGDPYYNKSLPNGYYYF